MPRPLKNVVRSMRLTEAQDTRCDTMIGYRQLWSFSDLVGAGLELLWQEYQRSITPPPPPELPAPPARKGGEK